MFDDIKYLILFSLFALCFPLAAAHAQNNAQVETCQESGVGIQDIELPATNNIRLFYNRNVSVFRINTEEPAGSPAGLVIIISQKTTDNSTNCFSILRFASVDLKNTTSTYEPQTGLHLKVPIKTFNPETSEVKVGAPLRVRVNLKENTVTLE